MPINCFRSPKSSSTSPPEPLARPVLTSTRSKKPSFGRSQTSRSSSNSSISQLPSRDRSSDPKIDALMMPVPEDDCGPPRCLRVSYPRIYGDIVGDMRRVKGCRDWRNFAVFNEEGETEGMTAAEGGRKRRADWERRMRKYGSEGSNEYIGELDTIG